MKPRTAKEKEVWELYKKLPNISQKQRIYAEEHCSERIGYKCGDLVWCTQCGCEFEYKNSDLGVTLGIGNKLKCPRCGKQLEIKVSQKRKINEKYYFTIATTIGGWQVLRHFLVVKYMVRISKYINGCQQPHYNIQEAVQNWVDETGKEVIIARPRAMSHFYRDAWVFNKPMEIRKPYNGYSYNPDPYLIYAEAVYPYMSVLPIIRRNGLKGKLPDVDIKTLIKSLLTDSRAETLMKAGQFSLLKQFCYCGYVPFWHSVLIAIRNKYVVSDASLWKDMLEALQYLGKDTHNAFYVCPKNLKESHDYWIKLMQRKKDKISAEKRRKEQLHWEEQYRTDKGKYFGIVIDGGNIVVRVIQSVREMQEEGSEMHHCVASNGYYKKEESLILSAKDTKGKRLETIEVNLKTFKVVQCFGPCNSRTEHHDEILKLMSKNMDVIRKASYGKN